MGATFINRRILAALERAFNMLTNQSIVPRPLEKQLVKLQRQSTRKSDLAQRKFRGVKYQCPPVSTRRNSNRKSSSCYILLATTVLLMIMCKDENVMGQLLQQRTAKQQLPLQQQQQQRMISTVQSNVKFPYPQQQQQLHHHHHEQEQGTQAPFQRAGLGMSQGPGIDLVALNWRRFELEHRHHGGHDTTGEDLKRGEMIESQLAAIPERILGQLPDDLTKQVIESLQADPSLIFSPAGASTLPLAAAAATEDPDGASIERLTKSCLTIQASSLTPEQLNVTFHLYTRRNPLQSFIVRPQASRNELLQASPFDPKHPIKWITHGFHTNLDKSEWMLEAKDKILANEEANVILTDWRRGASPALAFYPKAAANAHVVARMIVKILRRLWADINLSRVHLIGHSLGAHIMGFVGSAFTEEFLHNQQQVLATKMGEPAALTFESVDNQLIGRITACDPALPCFGPSSQAPNSGKMSGTLTSDQIRGSKGFKRPASGLDRFGASRRFRRQVGGITAQSQQAAALNFLADDWTPSMWTHLRPDSAILVEVMHTNPGVMGYAEPLGDFDFYPNGSERQPGCSAGAESPVVDEQNVDTPKQPPIKMSSRQMVQVRARDRDDLDSTSKRISNTIGKRQFGLVGSVMQMVSSYNQQQQQLSTGEAIPSTGGSYASLSKTLGQFIKPIRDFFQAYTCSHHRAVDYMVESIYYEQLEPTKRLESDQVCQMVGYRCADYQTFKRGHCFMCRNEFECRSFAMFGQAKSTIFASASASERFQMAQQPLVADYGREDPTTQTSRAEWTSAQASAPVILANNEQVANALLRHKRILPTLNQYKQNYKPIQKTRYYFDTKPVRNYCLHHYHLLIKYRWLRIRDSVAADRIRLSGTVGDLMVVPSQAQQHEHHHQQRLTFDKFTHHSYTMLLTSADFLGQLESLILFSSEGDRLKSRYIEHIDITYMSNIDPQVRAINSARMCRANQSNSQQQQQQQPAPGQRQIQLDSQLAQMMGVPEADQPNHRWTTGINLFVRCSQETPLVR